MRVTRIELIQGFNAYLKSAETKILQGDKRTYERRLIQLNKLKDLAVKIYAMDNVYVICDLILSRNSQLSNLYNGIELSDLIRSIKIIQFSRKECVTS